MRRAFVVGLFVSACGVPSENPDSGVHFVDDGGLYAPFDGGLEGRLAYPVGARHSPMNEEVVAHLQAIAAMNSGRAADVVSKIGASNTVSAGYLQCFAGSNIDFDGRTELDAGLAFFRDGTVDGGSAFTRVSLSATIGWAAQQSLTGDPTPLQQEVDAANPRYATVMFGTNDVGYMNPDLYGRSLVTIVDTLSMQGVIPIFTTVPPRDDDADANTWVPRYNLISRAVAQSRKIPFIDLHRELLTLPAHGLGPDGIHLASYSGGACQFTPAGLEFGHNLRNLATLEALDRTRRAVESGATPDSSTWRILGSGLPNEEIAIDELPFVDSRDTRIDGAANIASYPGCTNTNESGAEVLYKLNLTHTTNLRAYVISLGDADIDLHLLSAPNGTDCLTRNDKVIAQTLQPGTYWLSLDTYESSTAVLPGEYLLVVMAE